MRLGGWLLGGRLIRSMVEGRIVVYCRIKGRQIE